MKIVMCLVLVLFSSNVLAIDRFTETVYRTTEVHRTDYVGTFKLDPVHMQRFGYVQVALGVWRTWIPCYSAQNIKILPILHEVYDYNARFDVNNSGRGNIADVTATIDYVFRGNTKWNTGLEQ